ncbi:uncharacterized protein PHALS_10999 [Plasmopara halstedii]|uniref:Uncharacterized protein n=1 Tax=Plasmopara halstedii TaxID=4781 RepID=A0A0N7L591_PLAHL|nr:uncharacterized protein PHALS_10999 [Plasmopara halstedii]CEG40819.1 hypothetical protein PHALS_10999 [Plasmopara halstedii]|eukprot:XP_024577188.1 hypothetical protein PHALS_10999 [Plasmopara halstedii]
MDCRQSAKPRIYQERYTEVILSKIPCFHTNYSYFRIIFFGVNELLPLLCLVA